MTIKTTSPELILPSITGHWGASSTTGISYLPLPFLILYPHFDFLHLTRSYPCLSRYPFPLSSLWSFLVVFGLFATILSPQISIPNGFFGFCLFSDSSVMVFSCVRSARDAAMKAAQRFWAVGGKSIVIVLKNVIPAMMAALHSTRSKGVMPRCFLYDSISSFFICFSVSSFVFYPSFPVTEYPQVPGISRNTDQPHRLYNTRNPDLQCCISHKIYIWAFRPPRNSLY